MSTPAIGAVTQYLRDMRQRPRIRHLVPDGTTLSLCGARVKRPAAPDSDPCIVCQDILDNTPRDWTGR